MQYYPVIMHVNDTREGTELNVQAAADRFFKLNGVRPQIVTTADIGKIANKYWYSAWVWDVVPKSVEYVLYMDERIFPIRPLPPLPDLKFAAIIDRHDRIKQGKQRSKIIRATGKYFQLHVFFAHRDTQSTFDELKTLCDNPKYNIRHGKEDILGFDGRANFTPMNELIQSRFPVYELSRDWNWIITYEKQYYYNWPYMINFTSNEFATWAYARYVRHLVEQIEALGGSLEPA